jgi:GTP-binding protein EngB required for normal cell division
MDRMYAGVRSELGRCVDELTALEHVDRDACRWLRTKLRDEIFNLVAAGQFKRGKSSVINALLGESLLPVGVIPLTSVVTEVRYGDAISACVVFESGERREVMPDTVQAYATEAHNPRNVKGVREVLISYPSPWLERGLRLVDTPGIGSVFEHNTDVTQRYLPQADAVLFVGSVDQPMSRAELDFLENIRPYAAKIFCLLNKTDYLSADEMHESLAFSRRAIETALGVAVPIYPVSARRALEGKRAGDAGAQAASGFLAFEQTLRTFMTDDKELVWVRSIAQNLLRLVAQARLQVDLELAALAAPLEEVQQKLAAFAEEKRDVLRARAEYYVLVESNAKGLLKNDVEPALERFKREQQSHLAGLIEQWSRQLSALGSRQFADALEKKLSAEVRAAYDGWIAVEEPRTAQAFERICGRFWGEIQATVSDLLTYSANLFNLKFEAASQASLWSARSAFTYKFWYEPVGLKTITTSLILALPKRVGQRLILRQMHRRGEELIEIHAGRIRHDFDERLKSNVATFSRDLLSRIDATVAGIENAIDGGLRLRDRGQEHAAHRRAELAQSAAKLADLDARVTVVLRHAQEEVAA